MSCEYMVNGEYHNDAEIWIPWPASWSPCPSPAAWRLGFGLASPAASPRVRTRPSPALVCPPAADLPETAHNQSVYPPWVIKNAQVHKFKIISKLNEVSNETKIMTKILQFLNLFMSTHNQSQSF